MLASGLFFVAFGFLTRALGLVILRGKRRAPCFESLSGRRGYALGLGLVLPLVVHVGHARADESDGLMFDMRKIVATQEDLGWKIDKYEIEQMMPDALMSVCQAPQRIRLAALRQSQTKRDRLGGPPEKAKAEGRTLSEEPELLHASRVFELLEEATKRAPTECPIILATSDPFPGLQTSAQRWTLHLESGGLFVGQRAGGQTDIGAGGAGRLLLGWGFSQRRSILTGIEFGGNALFQRDDANANVNFPLQFTGALPFILRHHLLTIHHDLEVAPIIFFTEDDLRPNFGARFGVTFGLSTLRIRSIMPWAGAGLALEYAFSNGHRPTVVALKGGARLGFDWDF